MRFRNWLYYLNSRYYDPQTGRFVSEDGQLNPDTGLAGNNLFAYCNNKPVNSVDYAGTRFTEFDDGTGRWEEVDSVGVMHQGYISASSTDYDDSYDDLYDQQNNDRLRSSDAKKREKKQIDDAFGKKRADRQQKSKDLHDQKKKRGGGNDKNESWKDLNNLIIPLTGIGIIVTGTIAMIFITADDVTGVGIGDDPLIPVDAAYIGKGVQIFASAFSGV